MYSLGMTIPDFDAMTPEELMAFWSRCHIPNRKTVIEVVGDRPRGRDAVEILAVYACNLACAKRLRLEGEIARAMTYEHACELAYERLPTDLRW